MSAFFEVQNKNGSISSGKDSLGVQDKIGRRLCLTWNSEFLRYSGMFNIPDPKFNMRSKVTFCDYVTTLKILDDQTHTYSGWGQSDKKVKLSFPGKNSEFDLEMT